jgi:hypothetical protein
MVSATHWLTVLPLVWMLLCCASGLSAVLTRGVADGVSSLMNDNNPSDSSIFRGRTAYDFLFYVIVTSIVLNLVLGIIIDVCPCLSCLTYLSRPLANYERNVRPLLRMSRTTALSVHWDHMSLNTWEAFVAIFSRSTTFGSCSTSRIRIHLCRDYLDFIRYLNDLSPLERNYNEIFLYNEWIVKSSTFVFAVFADDSHVQCTIPCSALHGCLASCLSLFICFI